MGSVTTKLQDQSTAVYRMDTAYEPGERDSRAKTESLTKSSIGSAEQPTHEEDRGETKTILKCGPAKHKIIWMNVLILTCLHMAACLGLAMVIGGKIMWQTLVFSYLLHLLGGTGITAGAHRCFSHKSFKAKTQLRILLVIFQTIAFQKSIWHWVRDHRLHHKYSETDADPHNAKRGFFFAHVGWLLVRKHELLRVKRMQIDMSDIESDPVLMLQKKYYLPLGLLLCFVLPAYIPYKFWSESVLGGLLVAGILRLIFTLNVTWLVNSAAHLWGSKPYDKTINPVENLPVAVLALGEGWHNYHHTFPWDYRTAELGNHKFNFTTKFVDFFAKIGWAYDLKTVPKSVMEQRAKRTGDGSWAGAHSHYHHEDAPQGWITEDVVKDAEITKTLYAQKAE